MVSFILSTLALGLASLTTALPTQSTARNTEFTMSLVAENYPHLNLVAVQSSVLGNLNLLFRNPAIYTATPAYLNGTYLDFNYTGQYPGIFSANVPSVGDNYGYTVPVTAIFGQEDGTPGWDQRDGQVAFTGMHAALDRLYACNATVEGAGGVSSEELQLEYGVPQSDNKAPEGCVAASLAQHF